MHCAAQITNLKRKDPWNGMLTGGCWMKISVFPPLRIFFFCFHGFLFIFSFPPWGSFPVRLVVNSSFACADNNLKTNVFFQERRSLSREYKLPPCFRFRLKGETSWQTFPHTVFKYIFFSGFKGRNTVLKFQHQPMFAFSLKIAARGLCKSASLVISDFLKFNCKPNHWKLSFCLIRVIWSILYHFHTKTM